MLGIAAISQGFATVLLHIVNDRVRQAVANVLQKPLDYPWIGKSFRKTCRHSLMDALLQTRDGRFASGFDIAADDFKQSPNAG